MPGRPVADKPYLPVQGVNPDANGLAVSPEQSIFSKNLRYKRDRIVTRGGDRKLASYPPSGDPILHFHRYKKPDNTETLFGFTKNSIWAYNEGTEAWDYATKNTVLVADGDAFAGFDTDWDNISKDTNTYYQSPSSLETLSFTPHTNKFLDTVRVVGKGTITAFDIDLSGHNTISFWYYNYAAAQGSQYVDYNVKVRFYSGVYATLIESFDATITRTTAAVGTFTEVVLTMTTPANWSSVKSWEIYIDGNQTPPNASLGSYSFLLGYMTAQSRASNDVEFWSSADVQDNTEGLTVVAAGSLPPKANEAEDDGSKRELWFYDVSEGFFAPLTINRRIYTNDEAASPTATGPSSASTITGTASNTGIVGGTFSIYTAELGTIASSSAVTDSGGAAGRFALIPVDDTKIVAGGNSWFKADGTWSLEFADDSFSGLNLYLLYTYEQDSAYKPRYVWNYHNRLVMGNLWDGSNYFPWRVRWCAIERINRITDTDYADLIDNDASPITGGVHQGYALTILKGESIIKGTYIGGTAVFNFDTVWKDGTYAGKTAVVDRGYLYFLGRDDIYMWDGAQLRSVTSQQRELSIQERSSSMGFRIRNYIFDRLNYDKLNNCHAGIYKRFNEYWLGIVKSGETYPTSWFIYNIFQDTWYYFELSATVSIGFFHTKSKTTIDELVGTIDEQNWTFDSSILEGLDQALVLGYASGDTYLVDETLTTEGGYTDVTGTWIPGTDIAWYLITKDFISVNLESSDRWQKLDIEAEGVTFDVGIHADYSLDPASFEQKTTITPTTTFSKLRYFPDKVAIHLRFLLEGSGRIAIRWMQSFAIREQLWND